MNIDNIDIRNENGVFANLSFNDPGATNPYIMRNLYGLDADEISATFLPGGDNQTYGLRMKQREVVMRIVLNPDWSSQSYSQLRDNLYKSIAATRTGKLTLSFKLGSTITAEVSGFVTKFEVPHSEPDPELQITLLCEDGLLRDPNVTDLTGQFSGSYGNLEDLIFTEPDSTAPHGFTFAINITSSLASFSLGSTTSDTPKWEFWINSLQWGGGSGFSPGDRVYIISEDGNRQCYAYDASSGNTYGLADRIQPYSIWPKIFPGENKLGMRSNGGSWTIRHLYYNKSYWGV